jgi:hypothetical protein
VGNYCGPKRLATVGELAKLERAGWIAEEKLDGVYCEAWIGSGGRVQLARYRSGARVGGDSGRDLIGLRTPWPAGTVVVGELMTETPAAHRWQDSHDGLRGLVLFDILAWGNVDAQFRQLATGTLGTTALPARDMTTAPYHERRAVLERLYEDVSGRAAGVLHLVQQRRRGLRGWYEGIVAAGGEGIVVKDPAGTVGKGSRKVKRKDDITARVIAVLPDEGCIRLDWGGRQFGTSLPAFAVSVGQLVDVSAIGFYDSDLPRHARIVRVRNDL